MDLTIDQIKEVAEKQPELKNAIISSFTPDFLKTPPADVVIRTKDEDKKYLDSHVSAVVEERVSKESQARVDQEFGKMLTNIDQHVESVTGLKRIPVRKHSTLLKGHWRKSKELRVVIPLPKNGSASWKRR
jgi:hypothetical protein